jgi:DNA-binding response OmpR family regulator
MEQRSPRILVVDDEDTIRLTLDALLRRRGYAVTTAASGEAALELIEQHGFDMLLLDLKLPGLSGLDVAERARTALPEAAILIVTGSTSLDGTPDDPRLELYDYILKTASPREVLDRIAAMLA